MSHALDHALRICKLVKYSPRGDAIFHKMKEELTLHVPGVHTFCPPHWTVKGNRLESIHRNYHSLSATWEESVTVVQQSEVTARINGVAAIMKQFKLLFCLMLADHVLKHIDNLSKTRQATNMSAIEAQQVSKLCVDTLEKTRDESSFDFYGLIA